MSEESRKEGSPVFVTTHWSVVLGAGCDESPRATQALEQLCRSYWYPLYSYVRRRGYGAEDAKDHVQGFFARFLEKDYLADIDHNKGKFRSFLIVSLNHFLSDQADRVNAIKRGGSTQIVSLDDEGAEDRFRLEPKTEDSPERLYERRWAITLLQQAMNHLKQEYDGSQKMGLFAELKPYLMERPSDGEYERVAQKLGLTLSAVTSQVHRMRKRFRELVRFEVAHTVADPSEIEDEMNYLMGVF